MKEVRQSLSRCRSSCVATSFHAVVQRGINPDGCSITLHDEQKKRIARREPARMASA
jgi:hypothetical protein